MRETLEKVRALQEINSRIDQLRADRDRLSIDVRDQAALLQQKKQEAEEVHGRRIELTKKADRAQLRIEEAEQENRELKSKLNVVSSQKEYDAVQHMIHSHEADIQKWEDEALSALQTVDDLNLEEKRLARQIEEADSELQSIRARVREQTEEHNRRIEQLERQREQTRRDIDDHVLAAYDRLAVRHPHNALAEVKNRVCSGCYTQITKQTEVLLMRDEKLVYCHSCGRMLMLQDALQK